MFASVKDAPFEAQGDGVTDDTAAFQSAIDACPEGQAILVPAGTFRVDTLRITRSITVRGAGPSETRLTVEGSIQIGNYQVHQRTVASWLSGFAKASRVITLSSTSHLAVGQEILLDELNDPELVSPIGNEGLYTASGRTGTNPWSGSARCAPQIVAVAEIAGQQVTVDPPLYREFSSSRSPEAFAWQTSTAKGSLRNVGIEDLSIDGALSTDQFLIDFTFCSYSWVANCEILRTPRAGLLFRYCFRCEITDSYLHDAKSVGSQSYGVELMASTACLVQNNVFDRLVASVMLGAANSGCVIAYNYVHSVAGDSWLYGSIYTHAVHNSMHLFEGNLMPSIVLDNIHGSGSHNTIFRNRLPGWEAGKSGLLFPLYIEANNHFINVVGNTLGTAGFHNVVEIEGTDYDPYSHYVYVLGYWSVSTWKAGSTNDSRVAETLLRHGNYDFASGAVSWDPSINERQLPASLYLESKPAWWSDLPWPAYGPDVDSTAGMIPAKLRFEAIESVPSLPTAPSGLSVSSLQ